jgi:hypothetical protein
MYCEVQSPWRKLHFTVEFALSETLIYLLINIDFVVVLLAGAASSFAGLFAAVVSFVAYSVAFVACYFVFALARHQVQLQSYSL